MGRKYFCGMALDYKAQECEDECSLREYCDKCCKEYKACFVKPTIVDGEEVTRPNHDSSALSCLYYLFTCGFYTFDDLKRPL